MVSAHISDVGDLGYMSRKVTNDLLFSNPCVYLHT